MPNQISGPALAAVTAGIVFAYGAVKGKSPSAALLSLVRGNDPRKNPVTNALVDPTAGLSTGPTPGTSGSREGPGGAPSGSSAAHNQEIARLLLPSYGWGPQEMGPLSDLWNKESGWNNTADTRVTHAGGDGSGSSVFAYGIAQARPASKYPKPGQPPDMGGSADPTTQIKWGLEYIRGRYGSPSAAWAHEQSYNWY